jgi:hypothetical protein
MAHRLFVVENAFLIEGRGLILVPGFVPQGEEHLRIGDPIVLKRPDGSQLEWTIGGIATIHCSPRRPKNEVVIILRALNEGDLPGGSEVWSADVRPRGIGVNRAQRRP